MVTTNGAFRLLALVPVLIQSTVGVADSSMRRQNSDYASVCKEIESAISDASDVFYPAEQSYSSDNYHWATSSSQDSACSVEPGTTDDLGKVIQIIAKYKTPFAVKGGGHTLNPGFSSTKGVQIALTRFNDVVYDADAGTVDVGAGLKWDDVYDALADYNVNVVGGRVSGVGVAGFTLGGGYSFKTNQYGLTVDTVQKFELVLPNGSVTNVTSDNEDLFFALKGGYNNFGIVTKFTFKVFPQTEVWGGLIVYAGDDAMEKVANATVNFASNVTDPKAAIIPGLSSLSGVPGSSLNIFYDAPNPPDGIFDEFLNIPSVSKDVSTRSFVSLIRSSPTNATANRRGAFHTISVANYSSTLMNVILDQLRSVESNLTAGLLSTTYLTYEIEPFVSSHLTYGSDSAYPYSRSKVFYPLALFYSWVSSDNDSYFRDTIKQSAQAIEDAAVAEGQDISQAALYGNYAVDGTSMDRLYGDNLSRLESIKAQYDPDNVMGLAGGWKFVAS